MFKFEPILQYVNKTSVHHAKVAFKDLFHSPGFRGKVPAHIIENILEDNNWNSMYGGERPIPLAWTDLLETKMVELNEDGWWHWTDKTGFNVVKWT